MREVDPTTLRRRGAAYHFRGGRLRGSPDIRRRRHTGSARRDRWPASRGSECVCRRSRYPRSRAGPLPLWPSTQRPPILQPPRSRPRPATGRAAHLAGFEHAHGLPSHEFGHDRIPGARARTHIDRRRIDMRREGVGGGGEPSADREPSAEGMPSAASALSFAAARAARSAAKPVTRSACGASVAASDPPARGMGAVAGSTISLRVGADSARFETAPSESPPAAPSSSALHPAAKAASITTARS